MPLIGGRVSRITSNHTSKGSPVPRSRFTTALLGGAALLVLTGCVTVVEETEATPSAEPTQATEETSPAAERAEPTQAAEATEITPEPAGPTTESVQVTFTMPNLTGMVLQDAQDLLQASGSYFMDQEDATGEGRMQLNDSNWQVCSQEPAAGETVGTEATVLLRAVKLDETCP